MTLTDLIIAFFVVWLLSILITAIIDRTINNNKKVKQRERNYQIDLYEKNKQILFWRNEAETRNIK